MNENRNLPNIKKLVQINFSGLKSSYKNYLLHKEKSLQNFMILQKASEE